MSNFTSAPQHTPQQVDLTGQPTLPANIYNIPSTRSPRSGGKRTVRSWSLGMLEEYIKQQPALPGLLNVASRARTKPKMNAQRAAIRSAAANASRRFNPGDASKGLATPRGEDARPRITIASSSVTQRHDSLRPQGSQAYASGPLETIAEERQRSASPSGTANKRSSPECDRSQAYLIRTDLRYSPSEDTVVALLELPGLRLEDVRLRLGSRSSGVRHLIVTATSRRPSRAPGEVAMQERCYGTFTRTLVVPPHVMASDIQADMQDGLLILKIPGTKFEDVVIGNTKKEGVGQTKMEVQS